MLSGIVLGNFIQSTYSTYFHTSTIPSIGNYAHQTQNFDNPFIHFQNISLCEHLSDDWSRDREVHCCLQTSPLQTSPNWQLQVHLIVTQQFDMWLILFRSDRISILYIVSWLVCGLPICKLKTEDWKTERLRNWKTERLKDWKTERLRDWKTERLKDLKADKLALL